MQLVNFIIIFLVIIAIFLIYRKLTNVLKEKEFWTPFIAIVIALGTLLQANYKYAATVEIEKKVKNIAESVARLIAENQAWTMRFAPEGGPLRRMQRAREEINTFLDEVGTPKEKRNEILGVLNQMIEHDQKEEALKINGVRTP